MSESFSIILPTWTCADLESARPSLTVAVGLRLLLLVPGFRLWGVSLQLFQLLHQQRQVLQQVPVLQQQLVHTGLSLHPSSRLRRHLVLQQLHLEGKQRAEVVSPHVDTRRSGHGTRSWNESNGWKHLDVD